MPAPHDRIIFPLDVPAESEAIEYVRLLRGHVGVFKIGLELFVACGPSVVRAVKSEAPDVKVFLDLKFHDIPETVRRAVGSAVSLGVDFLTVHCESRAMMEAAREAAGAGCRVLGVTVLTSLSADELKEAGMEIRDPEALVLHRAGIAKEAGLAGVVCSGLEVKKVKKEYGEGFIAVTPGIRLYEGGMKKDDQKRVVSPFEAVRDGADYIVVGRPIRDAVDPVKAARFIAEKIEGGLKERKHA